MEDAHIACLDLNSILTQGPVQDPQKLEKLLEPEGEMEKREEEIILSEINNVKNDNNGANNNDGNDNNSDSNGNNSNNGDIGNNSGCGVGGVRESEEQEEIRRKEFLKGIAVFGVFD